MLKVSLFASPSVFQSFLSLWDIIPDDFHSLVLWGYLFRVLAPQSGNSSQGTSIAELSLPFLLEEENGREGGREGRTERERNINFLYIHQLLLVCALTRD